MIRRMMGAILLAIVLGGCAGQTCFQPLECYALPAYNHWTACAPVGADVCRWKQGRP